MVLVYYIVVMKRCYIDVMMGSLASNMFTRELLMIFCILISNLLCKTFQATAAACGLLTDGFKIGNIS